MTMSRYSGIIKLFSNKRMINRSVYFNREDRDLILDKWRKWYGVKFKKCRIQIDPNLSLEKEKIPFDLQEFFSVQKEISELKLANEEKEKLKPQKKPTPKPEYKRPPAIYDNQKSIYGVEKYW